MQKAVSFYSDGVRLSAYLHAADGPWTADRRPGIVACTGFGAVQAFYLPEICETLAAAGYVTLRFDYRGFGESDGARGRLIPMDQVEDIRNAITCLQQRPEVDAGRIGLYGAGQPKKLVILSGLTRHDVYKGDGFASVMRETLDWYRTFIPAS